VNWPAGEWTRELDARIHTELPGDLEDWRNWSRECSTTMWPRGRSLINVSISAPLSGSLVSMTSLKEVDFSLRNALRRDYFWNGMQRRGQSVTHMIVECVVQTCECLGCGRRPRSQHLLSVSDGLIKRDFCETSFFLTFVDNCVCDGFVPVEARRDEIHRCITWNPS
jgi:hypothetical protein